MYLLLLNPCSEIYLCACLCIKKYKGSAIQSELEHVTFVKSYCVILPMTSVCAGMQLCEDRFYRQRSLLCSGQMQETICIERKREELLKV
jgi:hypothetical protein